MLAMLLSYLLSRNLPSLFAIKVDTVASPVTFTTVLSISKGRSTAKIKANPMASFSPNSVLIGVLTCREKVWNCGAELWG